MRKQTISPLLLLLVPTLCLIVFGVTHWRRAHDLSPLLGAWDHPKESLDFHANGLVTETWRRKVNPDFDQSGHTDDRWYRVGDEIYIEGAKGYNQWLRCRWDIAADHKTLTLTKYYESGEVITRAYQRAAP